MYKLYNKAFKVGVLFSILLFAIFNLLSYFAAYKRYVEFRNVENNIAPVSRSFRWGFPFDWQGQVFYMTGDSIALNGLIIAFCSFTFGFLFRFIWLKIISSRRVELK
jgi:hypothetical protein